MCRERNAENCFPWGDIRFALARPGTRDRARRLPCNLFIVSGTRRPPRNERRENCADDLPGNLLRAISEFRFSRDEPSRKYISKKYFHSPRSETSIGILVSTLSKQRFVKVTRTISNDRMEFELYGRNDFARALKRFEIQERGPRNNCTINVQSSDRS